tara:strand:+ start:8599 stop:9363 length:765 start_codon:yes stop_codon:yes gene_type:complete
MTEKRRLFIDQTRLINQCDATNEIVLKADESHYLSRVMRMRVGDNLDVIDGRGHLWNAKIIDKSTIKVTTNFDNPFITLLRKKPLICIAISIPKKGFENFLQMSCEIGVDVIQPLISKRSMVKKNNSEKIIRWNKILQESVEQSERLWMPELKRGLILEHWMSNMNTDSQIAFANTRIEGLQDCVEWLDKVSPSVNQIWIAIGPEGGWDKDEEKLASDFGFVGVSMGENILRTSTAAVSACQMMVSWRRLKSSL